MDYVVRRDQAVWERETLLVTIPDDTPEDQIEEAIHEALDNGPYTPISETEIIDPVEGIDVQINYEEDI